MQKLSASVFALCVGLGSTVHAEPTTTRYVQKGASAEASASIDDPTGCLHGGLYILAAESTSKDETGSTSTGQVQASLGGFDSCENLSFGTQTIFYPLTTSLKGVQSYTFTFDAPVRVVHTDDDEGDGRPYEVQFTAKVTITATGDLEKSRSNFTTKIGLVRTTVRKRGTTREADVTIANPKFGGKKIQFLVNSGEIGDTKSANITITRN